MEKLTTAHNEQMLIDIRNDGISPNAKMPKHWHANTAKSPKSMIGTTPPGCGNFNI